MIPSILHSASRLLNSYEPRHPQFSNQGPRHPQLSNQIDASAVHWVSQRDSHGCEVVATSQVLATSAHEGRWPVLSPAFSSSLTFPPTVHGQCTHNSRVHWWTRNPKKNNTRNEDILCTTDSPQRLSHSSRLLNRLSLPRQPPYMNCWQDSDFGSK